MMAISFIGMSELVPAVVKSRRNASVSQDAYESIVWCVAADRYLVNLVILFFTPRSCFDP